MVDRTTIIGLVVAGYGAILATINSFVQVIAHRKDRADVVLLVRNNMVTNRFPYGDMTLTLVTATNKGKRPVTIEGFSTRLVDSRREYLLVDVRPVLPCPLAESQSVTAFVNEAGHDQSHVESYYVWDSVDRKFRVNMVPWHRRLVSKLRRKFSPVDWSKK